MTGRPWAPADLTAQTAIPAGVGAVTSASFQVTTNVTKSHR
jgi:hypothetical protein